MFNPPCDLSTFQKILQQTPFADASVEVFLTRDQQQAFVIWLPPSDARAYWVQAQQLVACTQRYPVLIQDGMALTSLSSDYGFGQEILSTAKDTSVDAILQAAQQLDLTMELQRHEQFHAAESTMDDVLEGVDGYVEQLHMSLGIAPSLSMVKQQILANEWQTSLPVQCWLVDWMAQHVDLSRLVGRPRAEVTIEQRQIPLIFLPTPHGEAVPAYLHFFGALSSPVLVALSHAWRTRHQTQLWGYTISTLSFDCPMPAQLGFVDAKQIAIAQYLIAPYDFLAGSETLCARVIQLMTQRTWLIHERP